MTAADPLPDADRLCPACGVPLRPRAVICVDCGYHLQLGHHLATTVDRPEQKTPRPLPPAVLTQNPYASPAGLEDRPESARPEFDLTEGGARAAAAVVADSQSVFLLIFLAWCCCAPAWLIMLPWYLYRLYSWHSLQAQFNELRNPNGFSPHGVLASQFQDARLRLWIGIIAGVIFWLLLAVYLAGKYLAGDH